MSTRSCRVLVSPGMGLPVGMPIMTMSMPGAMASTMAIICRKPAPREPWRAMGGL